MKSLLLYCLVGVMNTCIGFGIIFALTFLGILPELSNFLGYFFGIIFSFFLNNAITFSQNKIDKKQGLIRFILSMSIAYLINLAVLFLSYRVLEIDVYFSQILAGASYTLCGFLMSRFFVWARR
ncbi:GtrA family protein [Helicobacter brantae]|uniref:GtrA family protein n=1 Tax=Helicobacter brantae TaxID=375927 RepID=A0A3D8J4G4_9HELI|nr:GtrA family protein [Helicobacter brantae]RDU72120.1 GtrA family protein [Helicobacter brantae]